MAQANAKIPRKQRPAATSAKPMNPRPDERLYAAIEAHAQALKAFVVVAQENDEIEKSYPETDKSTAAKTARRD